MRSARVNVEVAPRQESLDVGPRERAGHPESGRVGHGGLRQQEGRIVEAKVSGIMGMHHGGIAEGDRDQVGELPLESGDHRDEPIEPPEPVERPGHERDDPRSVGDRPAADRKAVAVPGGEAPGLDAVVEDEEVVAVLGREEQALILGWGPGCDPVLQLDQIDRVGGGPPMRIALGPGFGLVARLATAGVEIAVEHLDDWGTWEGDGGEQRRPETIGPSKHDIDRPRPTRVEHFPAPEGVAERSFQHSWPGNARLLRHAADGEGDDLNTSPRRLGPGLAWARVYCRIINLKKYIWLLQDLKLSN